MKYNEKKIKEMASDMDYGCIKHGLWPEDAMEKIEKALTILGYQKVGEDKVILTKDEFRSMIKTDKEAEEYGQQCWNDGRALGQKEAVKQCIEWFFNNTVFTPQKVKEFAEQFGVNVITEGGNE